MKYGISHKENIKEFRRRQSASRRKQFPLMNAFATAKYRCKKRGVEFTIEPEDLIIPEFCPIMNIPLILSDGPRTDNTPSLDRVDNSKGYIKGNVRVISWLANCRKGDLTLEQVKSLLRYLEGS